MKEQPITMRQVKWPLAILVSAAFGLLLGTAIVSLFASVLSLAFRSDVFGSVQTIAFAGVVLASVPAFLLITLVPILPQRFVLPIVVSGWLAPIALLPVLMLYPDYTKQIASVVSFFEVTAALWIQRRLYGSYRFLLPFFWTRQIAIGSFPLRNAFFFFSMNLVLLPIVLVYLSFCISAAVSRWTDGFVVLRWTGVVVRARTYVREDHKIVRLVPMTHVADASFYRKVLASLDTNAVVLLEGIADTNRLLKTWFDPRPMARMLHLVSQDEFTPAQSRLVWADVDISQFSKRGIEFEQLDGRLDAHWTVSGMFQWLRFMCDPSFEREHAHNIDELRETNLVRVLRQELSRSDLIVVPWGAGHMRSIAGHVQKEGFRLHSTEECRAVTF